MIIRKKRIKKAFYNGAYFYLETNESTGGRRIKTHEFPYIEEPATEDFGRKAKHWNICGFIAGALYKQDSDKLMTALEKAGVGILDHPYLGKNKKVRCTDYRISENNSEYGIIRFSMTFTEAGTVPEIETALVDKFQNHSNLLSQAYKAFSEAVSDLQGHFEAASDQILEFTEAMEDSVAPLMALRESIGNWTNALITLKEAAIEIGREPMSLFNALSNAFDMISKSPSSVWSLFEVIARTVDPFLNVQAESTESYSTNGSEKTSSELKKEIQESINALALIYLGDVATQSDSLFDTDLQERFLERADRFLESTTSAVLFSAIHSLRTEAVQKFHALAKHSSISNEKLEQGTNSLLMSYELYGSLDKEEQLIELNKFDHPGFIRAGTQIRIPG